MATIPLLERGFRDGDITFEEFLDLIPNGQKADLLDGVIFMASPDNVDANDLNAWLCSVMRSYADALDLGKIYISRVAYRIGPKRGPEPDLSFVAKTMEARRRRGYIDGAPRLAIEIVSPDSVERDYVLKRAIYEAAGVGEYWILDPDESRATFLCLERGRFKERKPVRHIWRSRVLQGFWLDVRWLWDENRPNAHELVSRLLDAAR